MYTKRRSRPMLDKQYHVYVYKAAKSPDAYREAKNLRLYAGKKARVVSITAR